VGKVRPTPVRKAGVAFYFKQWGGTRKHLNGRELDGRTWDDKPVAADRPLTLVLSSNTTTSDS
jgi:protein gp37